MLSIGAMSGGQANYYLSLAREDYYLEGGEPPGKWFGKGAEAFGLTGTVQPDELYNLFDGRSPGGETFLVQKYRRKDSVAHRPGWDLTFSAPKSVSALWSQCDEEKRLAIQEIQAAAVLAAITYLQDEAGFTCRGKDGAILERAGLFVALFEHCTSRALDPQLHTHALFMNLSLRADGGTGALSCLHLYEAKMAAGAIYRAELSRLLEQRLGLTIVRDKSWFEIKGVSPKLIKEFSKRREEIVATLMEKGMSSAKAAAAATLETRSSKDFAHRSELFGAWRKDGERLGWGPSMARTLFGKSKQRIVFQELDAAVKRASERLTTDEAHFTRRDFIRYVAEECQGRGIGAKSLIEFAGSHLEKSSDIVRLGEHERNARYTTKQMYALEKEMLTRAEEMGSRSGHTVEDKVVSKVLETQRRSLEKEGKGISAEQEAAVRHITQNKGDIALVSGMAGTGKTTMLNAARECWEKGGYKVLGAAISARAARELGEGAEMDSMTIAKALVMAENGWLKLGKKSVLVVDEAGMVATSDMNKLLKITKDAGAKLVLVGDERQIQPIGPGAPFDELQKRFAPAKLETIVRQKEEWMVEAIKEMAEGKAKEAIQKFADKGFATVGETREESMRQLISQWKEDKVPVKETLILAGTKDEVKKLNNLAQDSRKKAGELGDLSVKVGEEKIHRGDRVMITKNQAKLGVYNGDKGTVTAILPGMGMLRVKLDTGKSVTIPTWASPHVQLGYASTTHKAQGATSLNAYILGGGKMQGRELAYVQASRAKLKTYIYATKAAVGDTIASLANEMSRSRRKSMAHSIVPKPRPTPSPSPSIN